MILDHEQTVWKIYLDSNGDGTKFDRDYSLEIVNTGEISQFTEGFVLSNQDGDRITLSDDDNDCDGDGLWDSDELAVTHFLSPYNANKYTYYEVYDDVEYPDFDKDSKYGIGSYGYVTSPTSADTDMDGLLDGKKITFEITNEAFDERKSIMAEASKSYIKTNFINTDESSQNRFDKLLKTQSLKPYYFEDDGKYYIIFDGEYSNQMNIQTSPINPDCDGDNIPDGYDANSTNKLQYLVVNFYDFEYIGDDPIIELVKSDAAKSATGYSTMQEFFGINSSPLERFNEYRACGGSITSLSDFNDADWEDIATSVIETRYGRFTNYLYIQCYIGDTSSEVIKVSSNALRSGSLNTEIMVKFEMDKKKAELYDNADLELELSVYRVIKELNEYTLDILYDIDNSNSDNNDQGTDRMTYDIFVIDDKYLEDDTYPYWTGEASNPLSDPYYAETDVEQLTGYAPFSSDESDLRDLEVTIELYYTNVYEE